MDIKIKSGKQIIDEFFDGIEKISDVDKNIVSLFNKLYLEGKLTDTNIKNGLQNLREKDAAKN